MQAFKTLFYTLKYFSKIYTQHLSKQINKIFYYTLAKLGCKLFFCSPDQIKNYIYNNNLNYNTSTSQCLRKLKEFFTKI